MSGRNQEDPIWRQLFPDLIARFDEADKRTGTFRGRPLDGSGPNGKADDGGRAAYNKWADGIGTGTGLYIAGAAALLVVVTSFL